MLNGERMAKHVPTVFNSTDIVTLAQVSPPAEGAGRVKARVLSKQQQGTSRVKARVLSQDARNISIWEPEIGFFALKPGKLIINLQHSGGCAAQSGSVAN
jgi:hypothetical protein